MIVTRVNFRHPETKAYQVGFGVKNGNSWVVRTYKEDVQILEQAEINATFESYNRDNRFIKWFFKGIL